MTDWAAIPDLVRARGLGWTHQRGTVLAVLAQTSGHVMGSRRVERCREIDPATTPATVRTLDVLEELGVISHRHGLDGREEFHVLPADDHGHLICGDCGAEEELPAAAAAPYLATLRREHGFAGQVAHLSVTGHCRECSDDLDAPIG